MEPDNDTGTEPTGTETETEHGTETGAGAESSDSWIDALPPEQQKYVRDLRDENAKRRVENKRYSEAFSNLTPAEQDYVLGLIKTLGEDTVEGAKAWRDVSYELLGKDLWDEDAPWAKAADEAADEITDAEKEKGRPLTEEEVDKIVQAKLEEAQRKAAEEASREEQIKALVKQANDLGYETGTEAYRRLFLEAEHFVEDHDLVKAHEQLVARGLGPGKKDDGSPEQEQEQEQEQDKSPKWPATASKGSAGSTIDTPKTWTMKEAKRRALERIEKAMSG